MNHGEHGERPSTRTATPVRGVASPCFSVSECRPDRRPESPAHASTACYHPLWCPYHLRWYLRQNPESPHTLPRLPSWQKHGYASQLSKGDRMPLGQIAADVVRTPDREALIDRTPYTHTHKEAPQVSVTEDSESIQLAGRAIFETLANFGVRSGDPAARKVLAVRCARAGMTIADAATLEEWFGEREAREGIGNISGLVAATFQSKAKWAPLLTDARRVLDQRRQRAKNHSAPDRNELRQVYDPNKPETLTQDTLSGLLLRTLSYHILDLKMDVEKAAAREGVDPDFADRLVKDGQAAKPPKYVRQKDRPAYLRYEQWKKGKKPLPRHNHIDPPVDTENKAALEAFPVYGERTEGDE